MNKNIIKRKEQYSYDELKNDLLFLRYEYSMLKIINIGNTFLGEEIKCIKLGEGRNKILINCGQNNQEEINSNIIMKFIEIFLEKKQTKEIYKGYDIEELWERNSIYIIPMLNIDGNNLIKNIKKIISKINKKNIEIEKWNGNIRGINLEKNYPYHWKNKKNIKFNFCGYNPLSEKETMAVYKLIKLYQFQWIITICSKEKEEGIYMNPETEKEKYKKIKEIFIKKEKRTKLRIHNYKEKNFIQELNIPEMIININKYNYKVQYDILEELIFNVLENSNEENVEKCQ